MERFHPRVVSNTPFLFFTGKGGVGKTSTACATAVALADEGKKVLIVSTDPASNLQDVFGVELNTKPRQIEGIANFFACNLDPEEAARTYREKVVGPYRGKLPEAVVNQMEEQLSGACTVEIAAFDEFTNLLANEEMTDGFDHILFDTAPTGHTLRLLQLPSAWSGFLEESTHGASCLGPLSGLQEKKSLYAKTVKALANREQTTLILVARPDTSTFYEAERASQELKELGIMNQSLIINGLMQNIDGGDEVASAFVERQQAAMAQLPSHLQQLKTYSLPFVSFSLTGLQSLRQFFATEDKQVKQGEETEGFVENLASLNDMIDDLVKQNIRVIFTMGKGGVGKTTIASNVAVMLAEKGQSVHLTTTDPAAHLEFYFKNKEVRENLRISRIDPKVEVQRYKDEVLARAMEGLHEEGLAYLQEDLNSPCTEEIAVFRAFADVVGRANDEVVVIDTAPTGHTLLLLDAAQSYHKELTRSTGEVPVSVQNLLPRLRNREETSVLIVTLPEATPVHEARRLQEDLKRAEIEPRWWIVNQSLYGTETKNPILKQKASSEVQWLQVVQNELAHQTALVPWQSEEKMKEVNV
ncbi:arsenical pump-driving ATPase [Bacillus tianshenii]|nr:arsenical pump-driving ATPase [Bacillus tianshenii]